MQKQSTYACSFHACGNVHARAEELVPPFITSQNSAYYLTGMQTKSTTKITSLRPQVLFERPHEKLKLLTTLVCVASHNNGMI